MIAARSCSAVVVVADHNSTLDHIPSSWVSDGAEAPAYSIDSILPPGRRRFLQLREPFMLLTNKSVARTGVLECALFELGRKLRADENGELRDLEWREQQFAILTGPDPESSDLWAPLTDRLLERRLMGLVKDRATTRRAVNWLEDRGYVFRRRMGASRNDRMVLPNIRKINYDQRDLPEYSGRKFKPIVTGSPDQMIEIPEGVFLTPLYEGLVEAVRDASGLDGMDVCRSALLLQRILHRAKIRHESGEDVAASWSVRAIHSTFGWGRKENWSGALKTLISSGLVLSRDGNLVEPNLHRIHAVCGTVCPIPLNGAIVDSQWGDSGRPQGQPWTGVEANVDAPRGDGGQAALLKGTEGFSESLSEFVAEIEFSGDFNPGEILAGHPVQQYRERRAVNFAIAKLKDEWSSLSFDKIAEADPVQAAALLELAEKMPTGERPAIAFPNNSDLSRALIAVCLGHWIDTHIGEGFRWVKTDEFAAVAGGDFGDERTELLTWLETPTSPLVIENVDAARRHPHARDSMLTAIKQHRDELMPVVFLGLPPRLSDLSNSLKGHPLAHSIHRILQERNKPVDHDSGLDISNPFKELL